jgi:hypothetical protein
MGRRLPEEMTDRTRHSGRGRIWPAVRLFNASLAVCVVLVLVPPACKKSSDATDAGPKDAAVKPVPAPMLPTPPWDLVEGMPEVPGQLGVRPGDTLEALKKARPKALVDTLTPALWSESLPAGGPVGHVTYLLTRDATNPPKVETLILALRPGYAHPEHWKAIEHAIADKLGAGKAVSHEGFEGLEWSVPGQRIEMRVDTRRDNEPELVFDLRGARQIEMP